MATVLNRTHQHSSSGSSIAPSEFSNAFSLTFLVTIDRFEGSVVIAATKLLEIFVVTLAGRVEERN